MTATTTTNEASRFLLGTVEEYEAMKQRVARLEAALREQLTFKANNPLVSVGDFDHLLDIARRALDPRKGFQRVKGVLPWKEGDELPEDAIRRLRDREDVPFIPANDDYADEWSEASILKRIQEGEA